MADLQDVCNTLVMLAAGTLYPNGTSQPSIASADVAVYVGWPSPDQLDIDLARGKVHVSVFPLPGMEANTTRFPQVMQQVQPTIPAPNLTLTVSGNRITVGGTINPGEAASALVNYQGYSYGISASDTLATVAAGLAAKIPNASASGNVITIGKVFDIGASVSVPVEMQQEIARQTHQIGITVWSPNPALRTAIAGAVDNFLKQSAQARILLPDNTLARLIYKGTIFSDSPSKAGLFRRDLRYEVEYVTSQSEIDNTVTFFGVNVTPNGGITTTVNI